jgi:N-acetylmuramoyl-L-alanine amidase
MPFNKLAGIVLALGLLIGAAWGAGAQEQIPGQAIVVLDPGHGGSDHGVQGPSGILEKDIVLTVAGRLKKKLEQNLGVKVILTRSGDYGATHLERSSTANHNLADLFVSLHMGASRSQTADNFIAFYPGSKGIRGGDGARGDGQWQVWRDQYVPHQRAGQELAAIIQERADVWLMRDRSEPLEAGLLVLMGVDRPAVLIEMGSLTNPERERTCEEEHYLEDLTALLYEALASFLEGEHEKI